MSYLDIFSQRLCELRKNERLKQKELADILHLSDGAISSMENGARGTSVDKLIEMAQYFHVSTDYLVGLTDDPTPSKPRKKLPRLRPIE